MLPSTQLQTPKHNMQYPPVLAHKLSPRTQLLQHKQHSDKTLFVQRSILFLSVLTNEPDIWSAATCTLLEITARYISFRFNCFYFPFSVVLLLLLLQQTERERDVYQHITYTVVLRTWRPTLPFVLQYNISITHNVITAFNQLPPFHRSSMWVMFN